MVALLSLPPAGATLLPEPHAMVRPEGPVLDLGAGCRITAAAEPDIRPRRYLEEQLLARGIAVQAAGPSITLRVEPGGATGAAAQGYRLTVARDGVIIGAPTEAGLFYGAVTLLQWIDAAPGRSLIPPVAVTDAPDLMLRGLTIDFRYAGMTREQIRRAIDRAATLKANLLVWWLQDRFAWRSHPELAGPGALSATAWKELVAYADARYIQMVPYVDAYGHGERYLEHPKWKSLSRGEHGFWGEDDLQYCASHPKSWTLFDDLSREAAAVFTNSPYLHIGMDEVGAQDARLCPDCRAAVRAIAKASGEPAPYPRARNRFVARRLADAVTRAARLGRRVMCWDDSATTVGTLAFGPGGIDTVPDSVTPLLWHYDADPAPARRALARPEARRFQTIIATSSNDADNIEHTIAATAAFPQVIGAVATIWEGDVRRFDRRWPGFALALGMGWNRGAGPAARAAAEALAPSGWAPLADPAAWTPDNDDSPPPDRSPAASRAVRFACPFPSMKDWRLVWDASTRLDLSGVSAAHLRVRASVPAAIAAVVVYFHSGSGWYKMPDLFPTRSWVTAEWLLAGAVTENTPVGWQSIDGVRVSLLPAQGPRRTTTVELEFPPD